jgi:hypothetical protein
VELRTAVVTAVKTAVLFLVLVGLLAIIANILENQYRMSSAVILLSMVLVGGLVGMSGTLAGYFIPQGTHRQTNMVILSRILVADDVALAAIAIVLIAAARF